MYTIRMQRFRYYKYEFNVSCYLFHIQYLDIEYICLSCYLSKSNYPGESFFIKIFPYKENISTVESAGVQGSICL